MKPLLKTLTEIVSPSGHEDAIREEVLKLVKPHADEIRVDALGNLIARKGRAAKNGKRIMLAFILATMAIPSDIPPGRAMRIDPPAALRTESPLESRKTARPGQETKRHVDH